MFKKAHKSNCNFVFFKMPGMSFKGLTRVLLLACLFPFNFHPFYPSLSATLKITTNSIELHLRTVSGKNMKKEEGKPSFSPKMTSQVTHEHSVRKSLRLQEAN
jgi:hypothetical protein